jgi:hypothetical protein
VQLQRIQQAHQCGAGIYRSPLQRRAGSLCNSYRTMHHVLHFAVNLQ